jgi:Zn-dependent oligopeptidase
MYLSRDDYTFLKFEKAKAKGKMYNAVLIDNKTKRERRIPFGDSTMENFQDKTGLNLYPRLIHGDPKRRKAFQSRFRHLLKDGYYSAGFYSYNYLW